MTIPVWLQSMPRLIPDEEKAREEQFPTESIIRRENGKFYYKGAYDLWWEIRTENGAGQRLCDMTDVVHLIYLGGML